VLVDLLFKEVLIAGIAHYARSVVNEITEKKRRDSNNKASSEK
jgi:hypothetical protein